MGKKDLAKAYSYDVKYTLSKDNDTIKYEETTLSAWRYIKGSDSYRSYKTKMTVKDLPEHYCDCTRYAGHRDVIDASGVTDIIYSWVKENHFMKDSMLIISWSGKIEEYYPVYNIDGEQRTSSILSYKNEDWDIFGFSVFKFLAYAQKYSGFDISHIKSQVIEQCEWLKEHHPEYAPKTDDFGKWFDETIEKSLKEEI